MKTKLETLVYVAALAIGAMLVCCSSGCISTKSVRKFIKDDVPQGSVEKVTHALETPFGGWSVAVHSAVHDEKDNIAVANGKGEIHILGSLYHSETEVSGVNVGKVILVSPSTPTTP